MSQAKLIVMQPRQVTVKVIAEARKVIVMQVRQTLLRRAA